MTEHKPWLSLPDEDPPERGLAELLAAARVKAEVMASPPWWKRMFAVLRRPPVLALATVMILIGGVIVVGGHHDTASSPAPSLDVPAGPLDTRARSTAPEAPPPAPPPPPHEVRTEKQLDESPHVGGAALDDTKQAAPQVETEEATDSADDRGETLKAGAIQGKKAPLDPLARCRQAAARRDCAAAKACMKDLGKVDVANDATLKSCL
ncbi:MAG: hypothetical protein JO257_19120 [Deltaproteobacteria bacterium]|nr:hypothetical protein [Deltaproteobacteria bacterium]